MKTYAPHAAASAFLGLLAAAAWAAEPKPITEVDTAALTQETQQTRDDGRLDLIWYLPVEFWSASLRQDPNVPAPQAELIIETLEPFFMVGVVQADVSPFGAFDYYRRAEVGKQLDVFFVDGAGKETALPVVDNPGPDVEMLLTQVTPVLTAAMGALGQNFHFFVFRDRDAEGKRIVSPYDLGELRIGTAGRDGAAPNAFGFSLPLDTLHIPRVCPNGEPAHVSWNFCPWTGAKLPE
ncbi:MAG: hypothetical protein AAF710_03235 [Planctomycetota bacterium]